MDGEINLVQFGFRIINEINEIKPPINMKSVLYHKNNNENERVIATLFNYLDEEERCYLSMLVRDSHEDMGIRQRVIDKYPESTNKHKIVKLINSLDNHPGKHIRFYVERMIDTLVDADFSAIFLPYREMDPSATIMDLVANVSKRRNFFPVVCFVNNVLSITVIVDIKPLQGVKLH